MLPKQNRADKNSIKDIFHRGRFVNSANLTFKFIPRATKGEPKISVLSPKTASKSAVKRNLLRRRGYKAIQSLWPQFPSGVLGALVFGKGALVAFGATDKKNKLKAITDLENEIKIILSKLN